MAKINLPGTSLRQLSDITNEAYNPNIRPIALGIWQKHLDIKNPQWKFITAKSFFIKDETGSAHVMAMIDKRLPDIGIVGYFACTNSQVGAGVLDKSLSWFKQKGLKDVYGPINGTLPNDYRINLNDDYSFPGEPVNPIWHIDAFRLAGFKVFNRYASGITKHYLVLMRLSTKKPKKGFEHISVRPFDITNYEHDFENYHKLRNAIFPFQSIYCPAISLEERIYNSSEKFDPKYTFFLLDGDRTVGFVMGYVYDNKLVLKTIGILPEYRGQRLKGLLVNPIREQAKKDGLDACIFAMVREGNSVYKNRSPGVKVFRKYVTMHKKIYA